MYSALPLSHDLRRARARSLHRRASVAGRFARVRGAADPVAGDRGVALHRPVRFRSRPSRRTRRAAAPRTSTTCPASVLAAAGADRRAGRPADPAQLRRHADPPRSGARGTRGVIFTDLDAAAAEHPDLVERTPARPRADGAHEVHRAARRVPHRGTFLYVPRDTQVELPLQTLTYVDADGAAVFPHTLIVVEPGARGDVHRPLRLARPRAGASATPSPRSHVGDGAHVRYAAIQDWGAGMTHLAVQRAAWAATPTSGRSASGSARTSRGPRPRSSSPEPGGFSELLGVFFADGEQHFDHRSSQEHVAPNCTSDLLYKGALRDRSRARLLRVGLRAPGRPADRRDADEPQHRAQRAREGRCDPEPGDRGQRREVRPCGERRAGRRRRALLPASPAGSRATRRSG